DLVGASTDHEFQQRAGVEAAAANQKIVGRPLAAFVLAPCFAQPFAVGFEAAGRQHAGARRDAFFATVLVTNENGGLEAAAMQFEARNRRVVTDLHAQSLSTAVVGV